MAAGAVGLIMAMSQTQRSYQYFLDTVVAERTTLLRIGTNVQRLATTEFQFLESLDMSLEEVALGIVDETDELIDQYEAYERGSAESMGADLETDLQSVERIRSELAAYQAGLQNLVALWSVKGIDTETGLRGELEARGAQVAVMISRYGTDSMVIDYLTVRRFEKQYLETRSQEYVDSNREAEATLRNSMATLNVRDVIHEAITELIDSYAAAFTRLVTTDQQIADLRDDLDVVYDLLLTNTERAIAAADEQLLTLRTDTDGAAARSVFILSLLMAAAVAFAIVMILLIFRSVSRPLRIIVDGAARIAAGNLSTDVVYGKRNEFGTIANGMNQAMTRLRELMSGLKSASTSSSELTEQLAESSTEAATAVTQITANVQSISDRNSALTDRTSATSQSASKIADGASRLAELVQGQSANVSETTAAVEEMIANIRNVTSIAESKQTSARALVKAAEEGNDLVGSTNEAVKEVTSLTGNIREVIKVINDIASQTNLLAMNAAIEAAHAGDAGRGFAVVAEEIRQLAESSSTNARQIGEMLESVTKRIDEVAESSSRSTTTFGSIKHEIQTFADSLQEIAQSMGEMSAGSGQVLAATESMSSSSEEINTQTGAIDRNVREISTAMGEIDDLASQVANGISEIRDALNEINSAVSDLSTMSDANRQSAKTMEEDLSRFTM